MTDNHDMTPIESSMLSHHKYDPNTRDLTVRFKNGLLYNYSDVPAEKYEAFTHSLSPGSYFNRRIKSTHMGKKVAK